MTRNGIKFDQLRIGDIVRFTSVQRGAACIFGQVAALNVHGMSGPLGYKDAVVVDDEGVRWVFGTGGHLGDEWTTGTGAVEWFCELVHRDRPY